MRHPESVYASFMLAILLIVFSSMATAVMPPAPPEWYQRMNVPIPEGIKNASQPLNLETIEKDLALAAQLRPDNTDNILLILVEFPDHLADQVSHPPQAYDDMMFSTGVIPTGSLLEYYQEISYGAFSPSGSVTAWVMAPNNYSYYVGYNYGMGSYPNNSQGLLEDCVELLDPTIDFSQFDNNGDGYAEGIFLVHAGPGAEETGSTSDIWSHAWFYSVHTDDGVNTGRYSIEPEEFINGSMIAIGVYCHEYGHVLGMPDLYDTDGSSEGVGVYCLMAGGSWGARPVTPERPTHMCAELKRRLGWMTPTVVTGSLADLVIPPAATHPVCYQVNHPTDPDQYFLIENRAKIGFDSLFRGDGGLAVWHVDWSGYQSNEAHRYVTMEEADGNYDLERDMGGGNSHVRTNRGDAGDLFPGQTGNDYFSFSSTPASYDYDLFSAFVTIDNIRYYADSMMINLYAVPDVPIFRLSSLEILDTVDGVPPPDHDGQADVGEEVDLVLTLACDGQSGGSITGTIQTTDSRVSVVDGSADFAAVLHNDYTDNSGSPFRVQIVSAETDSVVTFDLQLNADGNTYDLQFYLNLDRRKILVVFDNNGSHWSDNLIAAMRRSGYSFDAYNTALDGTPQYDQLIPYHAVLWTTASYFGNRTATGDYTYCLTNEELSVLDDYLDNAGRMGLFSQDYVYDRGIDAFAINYLYLANASQDMGCDHIGGVTGTFSDGFEGFMSEWTYYDYTDNLTPRAGAETVMKDYLTTRPVMINHPSAPVVGSMATTFSGFGIERLDDASLVAFLSAWCGWILSNANIDVPLPTSPVDGDTAATSTPAFVWTASDGAAGYHLQAATDFAFTNIVLDTNVVSNLAVPGDDFSDGAYYWRVSAVPTSGPATAFSPRADFVVYAPVVYTCGDANGDGSVNVGDAVFLVAYVFKGGPAPDPLCMGDANGDGDVNVGDAVYIVAYVFKGGPSPVTPCCP